MVILVIPVSGKLRQNCYKFKASLRYRASHFSEEKKIITEPKDPILSH